uniref:Uncharacterized protein n=1 Tax=Rhizophora mucronata TaxID=61149 RepID=A0A2P2Q5M9_RHIMU
MKSSIYILYQINHFFGRCQYVHHLQQHLNNHLWISVKELVSKSNEMQNQ